MKIKHNWMALILVSFLFVPGDLAAESRGTISGVKEKLRGTGGMCIKTDAPQPKSGQCPMEYTCKGFVRGTPPTPHILGKVTSCSQTDLSGKKVDCTFLFTNPIATMTIGNNPCAYKEDGTYISTANYDCPSTVDGSHKLEIIREPTAGGTVKYDSGECPNNCEPTILNNTQVILKAVPAANYTVRSWSVKSGSVDTGECVNISGLECSVMMNAPKKVTVNFQSTIAAPTLTVSKVGHGQGTVSSNPGGIDCGSTCSTSLSTGTSITLTAAAAPQSRFGGWLSGPCTGTMATCTFQVAGTQNVTAQFDLISTSATFNVINPGSGSGNVSSDNGLSCTNLTNSSPLCAGNFPQIQGPVNFTATVTDSLRNEFAGWQFPAGASCTPMGQTQLQCLPPTAGGNLELKAVFNSRCKGAGATCGMHLECCSGICSTTCQ